VSATSGSASQPRRAIEGGQLQPAATEVPVKGTNPLVGKVVSIDPARCVQHMAGSCTQWLRVGAVAAGLGLALTAGHGVASAQPSDTRSESSGTSASDSAGQKAKSKSATRGTVGSANTSESQRPAGARSPASSARGSTVSRNTVGNRDDVKEGPARRPLPSQTAATKLPGAQDVSTSSSAGRRADAERAAAQPTAASTSVTSDLVRPFGSLTRTVTNPIPGAPIAPLVNSLLFLARDMNGR